MKKLVVPLLYDTGGHYVTGVSFIGASLILTAGLTPSVPEDSAQCIAWCPCENTLNIRNTTLTGCDVVSTWVQWWSWQLRVPNTWCQKTRVLHTDSHFVSRINTWRFPTVHHLGIAAAFYLSTCESIVVCGRVWVVQIKLTTTMFEYPRHRLNMLTTTMPRLVILSIGWTC
jgi:hypothetical protein